MEWKPIESAPVANNKKMFVVIAIDAKIPDLEKKYTSDPYCVWRGKNGEFVRWPHDFQPTHWCELPEIT